MSVVELDKYKYNFTEDLYINISYLVTGVRVPAQPHKPVFYSTLFAVVAVSLSSIIFIFGILGNILVVIVIARIRSMHTPTNCYLLSLAVADSLVLVSATLPAIPEAFYRVDEWPYGRVMCSLLIFLQYLGIDSSSLSITAFTIERYIAICHPMKAQIICTVSRAKKIIVALWTFTVLYCSPWLGLTDTTETLADKDNPVQKCHFRLARSSYLILFLFDLILMYVIPLMIATVLYLLIGRILCLSTAMRKNDKVTERRPLKHLAAWRGDSRIQVVRMLVVVVAAFAVLWMPYRVMVVYNSFAQNQYMDLWFLLFARTMVYINCAINPVLYNIMSVKFKRAFQNYLTCWHRRLSTPPHTCSEMPTNMRANRPQFCGHPKLQRGSADSGGSSGTTQRHNSAMRHTRQPTGKLKVSINRDSSSVRVSCRCECKEADIAEQAV